MDLTTTNPLSSLGSSSAPVTTPQTSLGKDDFLRLLTTQLTNQDPLQPVDNQAFIAQLAQFSSVEQLGNVSSDLEKLIVSQGTQNQLSAAGLVGKRIVYDSGELDLASAGAAASTGATLPQAATVSVAIQDANGRAVRTLQLGPCAAGTVSIAWDGRDDAGRPAPAGSYTVVPTAKDATGAAVTITPQATGLVTGAAFDASGPVLIVGGSRVKLSDVVQIQQQQG